MLITRRAAMRKEKIVELINGWSGPSFDLTSRTARCTVYGTDRGNQYRYTISLEVQELLAMLGEGVQKTSKSASERALAKGALSVLEELLKKHESGAD